MKITKLNHSCLLVEMPAPVNRTVLFDPGNFSEQALDVDSLEFLDDIIITHEHSDHMHVPLIQKLIAKFPSARITAPPSAAQKLKLEGIQTDSEPAEGIILFDAPHEGHPPFITPPDEYGVHYLGKLSHPGDSHSFKETKQILALPIQGPWGSTDRAVQLALELKPIHILPIHDWHWKDEVRETMYDRLEQLFKDQGIAFHKIQTGKPIVIDI